MASSFWKISSYHTRHFPREGGLFKTRGTGFTEIFIGRIMPAGLHIDRNSGQRPPRSLERSYQTTLSTPEKPLRFERISGLGEEQIDELERRVALLPFRHPTQQPGFVKDQGLPLERPGPGWDTRVAPAPAASRAAMAANIHPSRKAARACPAA